MGNAVRQARSDAGLSQAQLAAAAGISRQAVGAVEAGRHSPSVDAALALARAVGWPVEELFAPTNATAAAEPVSGARLPHGAPVLATQVGEDVVYAPAADALGIEGWPTANAVLDGRGVRVLPGADLDALMVIGCDPALSVAAALMPAGGAQRVIALSGSTGAALAATRAGRAHAALVHGRARRLPKAPPGTLRMHVARWRVGIASSGRRARSVAELCERRVRVVQRETGASSQRAFASALATAGCSHLDGPVAAGHLDAARRVVAGGASAAVTMEPAALRFGLAFEPLEEHVAELWVEPRHKAHPAVGTLSDTLRSAAFTARMGLVGGYDLS
jgi:DNA-binding XRE family transcriptional regulator